MSCKQEIALMLLLIWADEKYNTQKNPCVVFATQKNPRVFHRPKKIPFGQNVRPKKILRTPPSLKYVSGAPGGPLLKVLYTLARTLLNFLVISFYKKNIVVFWNPHMCFYLQIKGLGHNHLLLYLSVSMHGVMRYVQKCMLMRFMNHKIRCPLP